MTDTLVTVLTPPGKAAIATIAVRGPQAWTIARQLFKPAHGVLSETLEPGRFRFGKLAGDDVVLTIKPDSIEIHCHGGVEMVRAIEEAFVQHGARVVPWQLFVGDAGPILDLLANAPTTRTTNILLDQLNGAWERRTKDVARLRELIPLGQHLVTPWKVVLAGAPNVGKSSLMNALAGYTRSIVAPTPGTTRDVVTLRVAIDGWPIELADTAGMRDEGGIIEKLGIERARVAMATADLRLWLVDASTSPTFPDDAGAWICVINKCDLPAAWNWNRDEKPLRISALTGAGIAELCETISKTLVRNPPAPGEAVPCLPEHFAGVIERPREADACRGRKATVEE
jgi:tRNA modification GTPase